MNLMESMTNNMMCHGMSWSIAMGFMGYGHLSSSISYWEIP